jgi:hypothetical protein
LELVQMAARKLQFGQRLALAAAAVRQASRQELVHMLRLVTARSVVAARAVEATTLRMVMEAMAAQVV